MANVDWRFAIELVSGPDAEYGWLNLDSATDIYGDYEYIDWRSEGIKKPSREELETAWNEYVATNGTPEEQEAAKGAEKEAAKERLEARATTDADLADLLKLL